MTLVCLIGRGRRRLRLPRPFFVPFGKISPMKKFTVNQLALLGSIFWNDEDNLAEFIECAKRVKQFIDLGDPYDVALILSFLGQIFKPEGALADEKNLENYVVKVVYWLEK